MASKLWFLVALLVCFTLIKESAACKCIAIADETKICLADYAIKATILTAVEGETPHSYFNYTVSVDEVFRKSERMTSLATASTLMIITSTHTCGFPDLEIGQAYFLAGRLHHGIPALHRCPSVVAQYRDGIPYRVPDMKVDTNPDCPAALPENINIGIHDGHEHIENNMGEEEKEKDGEGYHGEGGGGEDSGVSFTVSMLLMSLSSVFALSLR